MSAAVRPPPLESEQTPRDRWKRVVQTILRYLMLLATFGGYIVGLLVLRNGYLVLFALLSGGSTDFTIRSRYDLLDKALLIVLAVATLAVVFLGDAFYGKAKSIPDLLRRFARMAGWLTVVFLASHATTWVAAGARFDFSIVVPAAELVLGTALFAVSIHRKAR